MTMTTETEKLTGRAGMDSMIERLSQTAPMKIVGINEGGEAALEALTAGMPCPKCGEVLYVEEFRGRRWLRCESQTCDFPEQSLGTIADFLKNDAERKAA